MNSSITYLFFGGRIFPGSHIIASNFQLHIYLDLRKLSLHSTLTGRFYASIQPSCNTFVHLDGVKDFNTGRDCLHETISNETGTLGDFLE